MGFARSSQIISKLKICYCSPSLPHSLLCFLYIGLHAYFYGWRITDSDESEPKRFCEVSEAYTRWIVWVSPITPVPEKYNYMNIVGVIGCIDVTLATIEQSNSYNVTLRSYGYNEWNSRTIYSACHGRQLLHDTY